MSNPLARKLQHFSRLSVDDINAIDVACQRVRTLEARGDIIREGDVPEFVNVILSGWACRYKQLEDGRRQILAYFLPGDLCDLRIFIFRHMDHSIAALTPITLAEIDRATILELTDNSSRLSRSLWWSALVSEAIEREWIVNLGQRNAFERIGHLFCELFNRQRAVGLTDGDKCEMPISQTELAETVGLSTVHVNRTLQELRSEGLINLRQKTLTIPDLDRLQKASLFNANYLHLDGEGSELDANETP